MDDINNAVEHLLDTYQHSEIEIEARIKKQLVNESSQLLLIRQSNVKWTTEKYAEKRRISKSDRKCAYRQRNNVTICKSSIAKEDINDAWCTLHVSTEISAPSACDMLINVAPVSVTRKRAEVHGHYIDIIYDSVQEYRVEVEVCDPRNFYPEFTLHVVKMVCTALQGSKEFVGYYDWFTVVHITKQTFGSAFCIDKKKYQKPHTMTVDTLYSVRDVNRWAVTPKVDGERRFIVIFDNRVFSIGLLKDVRLEGRYNGENQILILDCEFANDNFYVFDTIVVRKEYLRLEENVEYLSTRLGIAEDEINYMELFSQINIKQYFDFNSFQELCDLYNMFKTNNNYTIDGMIFICKDKEYMQTVQKWKPQNTVDLMVTKDFEIMTSDKHEVNKEITISNINAICEGIWEFSYDAENKVLHPVRPRPDKPTANSKEIVEVNMYHSVAESVFSGIGCNLMRKFHNTVKKQMIGEFCSNKVILDIGTGQGGDVKKWHKAKVKFVYSVEPEYEPILEAQERIEKIKKDENIKNVSYGIEFANKHIRDLDHNTINQKISVFVAFFCMNLFEDSDFESLKKLIDKKGTKDCRLLGIAITKPRNHNNKCFKMVMNGDDQYNIDMHSTRILGLKERRLNLNRFTNLLQMKLVKHKLLNYETFMAPEERQLSSMYEMFVYSK